MNNSDVASLSVGMQFPSEEAVIFENLVWMTSAEAARYLRKSYGALRVMVCRGYIKPRVFHRRWYFNRKELDRLIENS